MFTGVVVDSVRAQDQHICVTSTKFSREFKREAVHLVTQRGVSIAQAARDLDLHATVLSRWIREF